MSSNVLTAIANENRPTTNKVTQLIEGEPALFRERYNRYSFEFAHRLAGHPLFELPRLIELAKSMPPGEIYGDAGNVRVDQRWDQVPPSEMTIEEMLHRIEHSGAWILIRCARRDPEYAELLDRGLAEFQDLTGGALPKSMKKRDALVFITSPNRMTTYHIDRECNFLLQIRGGKTIHIHDRYDREVLPEEELEMFWAKDNNAAIYKDHLRDRAQTYELKPGTAVHIPVNAPHWLKNDNNISVTLSLNFQYHDSMLGNVYKTNYMLRKIGLKPTSPGRFYLLDTIKGSGIWPALKAAKQLNGKLKQVLHRRNRVDKQNG